MTVALLTILVGVGGLKAQALRPTDRGAAMLTRPISSKAELAEAFRNCKTSSLLRASCEQYLESFQIVDPDGAPQSVAALPGYVMDLVQVRCPSGRGILSRILMPSRRMDHRWARDFEVGEMCLMNNNTNRLILSMACGNTVLSPRTVGRPQEVSLKDTSEIKDTNRMAVPKGTVIRGRNSIVLDTSRVITTREPTMWTFTAVDTVSIPLPPLVKDTVGVFAVGSVRIVGPTGSRLLTRPDTIINPQSIVMVDVGIVEKKGGGFWRYARWVLPFVGGFVIHEILDGDDCGCKLPRSGGPVDPPN